MTSSRTLADQTCDRIGLAIVRGDYPIDQALPVEAELIKSLDISRNILREAVKVLSGKGLLVARRRAGIFVAPMADWNFLDADVLRWALSDPIRQEQVLAELTQLRTILEPEIAALAASRATTEDQLRLVLAYEAMVAGQNDPEAAIAADIDFHRRLLLASHNGLLTSFLPALSTLLRANFAKSIRTPDGFIRNLADHHAIAEAVRHRDPAAAREAMRTLLCKNEADLAASPAD
ncbi:FadR/GntR family transcriptional regulator [Arenibacterium sp. LLYu02]|uniref:FadR/GntR family transcriptional regulator n=1 Tax=Arenibacterium sp. LLYu02 TaxID=3404132 RepID=UPI003B212875